jgi:WD40 repeat protein/DNA-binding SARP family transcriptional activator/tRNA A-37 threonylcarbamoyl transferase component Bud32/energy-coupling factor transporter ATP-binding protein EcfA2
MSGLSLSLLGPYAAALDGRPLARFPTVRAQALLFYLAVEAAFGTAVQRRETLMDLLWPGMPSGSARKNLRQTMYYLRQTIGAPDGDQGAPPFLLADRYTVTLNPDYPLALDVARFLRLLEAPEDDWPEAAELYRGDFLSGFYVDGSAGYEEWVLARREYLRRRALDILERLTARASRRRNFDEARAHAERQLALDNLRERAHRQLMEILALSGYREAALAQYESCRLLLSEELGMEPSAQTSALYRRIQAGELSFELPLAQDVRGYELGEQIGEGAFAAVYRAFQPGVERDVAVKIIRQKYAEDPDFIRRFEVEAQTVARLEHPYIVPLYDFWRDPTGAYLVMRYMRGGDLQKALKKGPWPVDRSLKLVEQMTAALSAAHRHGVVHRDLKPANILFDQEGIAYLSDFGIAKYLDVDEPQAVGLSPATPEYSSPEQLKNEDVCPQSDIYALGMVLYETLTGNKPFGGVSVAGLIQRQLHEPLPPVTAARPELPVQLDEVVQRATAKRPADRYADALEFAQAFTLALEGRRLKSGAVRPAAVTGLTPGGRTNPYKGLHAFQEADASEFYGREALVRQLLARLDKGRFLAVVGPSGSGKSSVVKAGLVPALRAGAIPGSDRWYVAEMTPGPYPLEELEKALWPIAVDPPPSLVEPIRKDSEGLLRTIRRILPDEEGAQLVLIVDQFEELFTMVDDERRRNQFIDSLLAAVSNPASPLRLVVTLRADFYDRPLQVQALGNWLKENTEVVLPMSADELARAVQEPAQHVGVDVEAGLLAKLIADVRDQPGALPLLQYALTELFEQRQDGLMTRAAYETIGEVSGALGRRAESLYAALDDREQETARQLFLRLVTVNRGAGDGMPWADTRRRVLRPELEALGHSSAALGRARMEAVIDQYGRYRLLTFDRDPITRQPTVEVAHEALLQAWDRLQGWLDEARYDIRLQRLLAGAVDEWLAADQDDSFLMRGSRLGQFENWAAETGLALTQNESAFLEASLAARERRRAEEETRRQRELETARRLAETEAARAAEQTRAALSLRRRAVYLSAALVVAMVLAIMAAIAGRQASQSAAESRSLALASGAQIAFRDGNTDQALALAVAANQMADPPAFAQRMLYEVALAPGAVRQIVGDTAWRWSLDVDPSEQIVASGNDESGFTLWDIASGDELMRLEGAHTDGIGDVSFTPDGRSLLSGGFDDRLILWDIETGAVLRRFENPSGDVNVLDISSDGSMAIAGTEGGVATLWDLQSGRLLGQLAGHDPDLQVLPVVFSPDGRLAASGSEDGTVIVWDVAGQTILHRLEEHGGIIMALAFSSDGRYLASGAFDNLIIIWQVDSGESVIRLVGHKDYVFDVAFDTGGSRLLSASRDQTLILWDLVTGAPIQTYAGEGGRALSVAWLGSERAISGHSTGNLRVWALADAHLARGLPPVGAPVSSAAVSPDQRLGALGLVGQIWLLDLASGQTSRRLSLEGGEVSSLAFHPSGDLLLSGSADGSVSLWDVPTGEMARGYEGHARPGEEPALGTTWRVHDLAFSPDGRSFLSASGDHSVRLWDVETGAILQHHQSPTDMANAAAFDPMGRYLAAGFGHTRFGLATENPDYSIGLWDATTGAQIHRFVGHEGPVVSLQFSPDGQTLLSGSLDNTLRLWSLDRGAEIRRFDGHTGGVFSLAFSADGQYAASGSLDASAIVWRLATGDLLRRWDVESSLLDVRFGDEGHLLWSAAADGSLNAWTTALDLEELMAWTAANRYIRPLSCSERDLYQLNGQCS